jgi:hypothetical protein
MKDMSAYIRYLVLVVKLSGALPSALAIHFSYDRLNGLSEDNGLW